MNASLFLSSFFLLFFWGGGSVKYSNTSVAETLYKEPVDFCVSTQ